MKRAVCGTSGMIDRPKKLSAQYIANARMIKASKGNSYSGTLVWISPHLCRVGYMLQLLVVFNPHLDFVRVRAYLRQGVFYHFGCPVAQLNAFLLDLGSGIFSGLGCQQ